MNEKQLVRLDVINKAISGFITVAEAAEALGISHRQIKRLKKEVKEQGAAALVHKNSLKIPHNAVTKECKEVIINLKQTDLYEGSNISHFKDLLSEYHNIDVSYSTIYRTLSEAGIRSPNKRRKYKPHRRRKRRKQAGLLLQVDASPYRWFGGRKYYSLHGAIDDATGQITALFMCKNECMQGYFQIFRRTINNYGIPVSIYADRHTIFQSPNKDKAVIDTSINVNDTQLGMALKDLAIELIPARSPQAKGRIERLWGTLQGRLPTEFAIRGIESVEQANEFLEKYIYTFNSEFAVEPENVDSCFRKLRDDLNLDYIFCIREQRVIDAGGVFSYANKTFKVEDGSYAGRLPAKSRITVLIHPNFGSSGIKASYKNMVFDVTRFIKPKTIKCADKPKGKPGPKSTLPDSHSYKYGQSLWQKGDYLIPDKEVIDMLENVFFR